MTKVKLKQTVSFVGKGLMKLAIGGVLYSLSKRTIDTTQCVTWLTADYSGAVSAITNSHMWSSDKNELVSILKRDGDASYYKTVITIVQNDTMFSSDKLKMVKTLSK